MASLYQVKRTGYWYLRVFEGRVNGKTKQRLISSGLHTTSKKPSPEVLKWQAEQTIKIVNDELPTEHLSRGTIIQNGKLYLKTLEGVRDHKTIRGYRDYFDRIQETQKLIGHEKAVLADYTKRAFIEKFKNYRNTVEVLAASTVNTEIRLIRILLERANLLTNDAKKIWNENRPQVAPSELGRDVREEVAIIEAVADANEDWEVAWQATKLAYGTGLRKDEVRKLKLGALDFAARKLKVHRRIDEMGQEKSGTKTNAGAREVVLGYDAYDAALFLYTRYQGICKKLGIEESDDHFLLPANLSYAREGKHGDIGTRERKLPEGKGYDPRYHVRNWDTAWYNLLEVAGIEPGKIRFHDLRHTYATRLAEAAVPIAVTQRMIGHMAPEMVSHYTHISDLSMQRAVAAMETGKQYHEVTDEAARAYLEKEGDGKLTGTRQLDKMQPKGGIQ